MSNGTRPTIPALEFPERRRRLRERMAVANVDTLIAYSDDRATFGQQNARYLFNYQPHFEPCLTVVQLDGDEFIATGPESEAFVRKTSYCTDVRIVDVFTHEHEEYPHHKVLKTAEALKSRSTAKRIAIAGAEALPKRAWEAIASGGAELADGDGIMYDLRAVKSAAEIAVIREAFRIAETGTKAALAAITPGVSEREIAAEAEHAMRRMGSEGMGIDTIVGSGKENTYAILTRTTHRRLVKGDHVLLTIAPRYEGYHGAIGRIAALGNIDKRIEAAMAVAVKAQEATAAALKPGNRGRELDRIARQVCREAGLEKHFAYTGIHSTGVVEFEPPILTSESELVLKKDMVFMIDIPVFFTDWGGLRVEDGFLVTDKGPEPLQSLAKDIYFVN